ncbi:hypothetical protein C772_01936 [Bhargavaea cecembensis DSE10]|uniref:DUF4440 domain-containing protein n=1 Tax=Bhargavaea cecembensis DSE10 TaxID=1235279 RepID=M7NFI1_9BACL|nr:DUF4440 domain-containing protein [Bhargavaea cecembensis]EMR05956.1 hypothetical protein C772_01936 [Bhargavaea cecembensis DSE10]
MEALTAHILKLETALLDNQVRNDPNRFGPFLDESFFEFGKSGGCFSKADCISAGSLGSVRLNIEQFRLQTIGEHAVLALYRTVDKETGRAANRSSIWKSDGITWKMLFHQGTPVPDK